MESAGSEIERLWHGLVVRRERDRGQRGYQRRVGCTAPADSALALGVRYVRARKSYDLARPGGIIFHETELAINVGDEVLERAIRIVFCPAEADFAAHSPATETGADRKCASMVSSGRHCFPAVRVDTLFVVTGAIRPGVHMAEAFLWIEIFPRVIKGGKARELCSRARVVPGIFKGIVVMGGGEVEGEIRVLEVVFELDAMLLLLVAGNAEVEARGSSHCVYRLGVGGRAGECGKTVRVQIPE